METALDKVFQSHTREYAKDKLNACFQAIELAQQQSDSKAAAAAMCSLVPEYSGAHQISSEPATATI